jgi:hypothetical protein
MYLKIDDLCFAKTGVNRLKAVIAPKQYESIIASSKLTAS